MFGNTEGKIIKWPKTFGNMEGRIIWCKSWVADRNLCRLLGRVAITWAECKQCDIWHNPNNHLTASRLTTVDFYPHQCLPGYMHICTKTIHTQFYALIFYCSRASWRVLLSFCISPPPGDAFGNYMVAAHLYLDSFPVVLYFNFCCLFYIFGA